MIYHTCPHCGANLDPGERCDCPDSAEDFKPHKTRRPYAGGYDYQMNTRKPRKERDAHEYFRP